MFIIRLIRWFNGYVIVRISGENAALFLNFLAEKSITVWNIRRDGDSIYLFMSLSSYKKIRELRRGFRHKVGISHTAFFGFPKKISFINRRKSLVIGFAFFCSVLFAMSQFVWEIEIIGNDTIAEKDIVSAYTQLGVYVGMPASQLDSYSLRDRLPLLVKKVSWSSFNLEGCKLTVNITEVSETDKDNKNSYSNIVAATDGIIRHITVSSGNKCVDVGDVVRKGDVLISGAPENNAQKFTYSEGNIYAEITRNITFRLPKVITVADKTGKKTTRSLLDFFGFRIPLYLDSVHFESEIRDKHSTVTFFGGELPIKITERSFSEVIRSTAERSESEALNDAYALLAGEIKKFDMTDIAVLSVDIEENGENYNISFKCKCVENIGEIKKINIAEEN